MTPKGIVAEANEVRVKLQAIASQKVGFGMDRIFQQILKIAYQFAGLTRELALRVEALESARQDSNEGQFLAKEKD